MYLLFSAAEISHKIVKQVMYWLKFTRSINLREEQNEWSLYEFWFNPFIKTGKWSILSTRPKVRITPIISALQDKQNEWSFYWLLSSTLQDKQNENSFYWFSWTGSNVGTNNTKHFYSSRQEKLMPVVLWFIVDRFWTKAWLNNTKLL